MTIKTKTNDKLDILKGKTLNTYLRYLLPSFGAMLVSCIYGLADTIFIGRYEGETGIAALNIVLPLYTLLYAIGIFFGVGGGILYSYEKAKGQNKEKKFFSISFVGVLFISLILVAVLNIWFKPIMEFMGAKPASNNAADLADAAKRMSLIESYGRYVTFGAPIVALNAFLTTFLRNDGAPNLAMIAIVTSGIINIIGDYLLVFTADMGMKGAAIATLSSMLISLLIASSHFLRKKCGLGFDFKGSLSALPTVLLRGFPSFFTDFAYAISMIAFNVALQKHIGYYAVSVYGVVCNVVMIFACLFLAIAAGVQPLLASNFGANNKKRVTDFFKLSLITTAIIAVIMYIAIFINPSMYVSLFINNPSQQVLDMTPLAMRINASALFFMGFNFVISSYYQSTLRSMLAFVITALRGLVFIIIFMLLIPQIFPDYIYGLWWVVPISDAITLIFAICYVLIRRKNHRKKKSL